MIDLVLGGGVGCVLAYGQTGESSRTPQREEHNRPMLTPLIHILHIFSHPTLKGSGKTYTMEAIERFVARDLFATAEKTTAKLLELKGGSVPDGVPTNPFEFRVTFLELLGKTASDLVHGELDLPKKVEVLETKVGYQS